MLMYMEAKLETHSNTTFVAIPVCPVPVCLFLNLAISGWYATVQEGFTTVDDISITLDRCMSQVTQLGSKASQIW